MDSTIMSSYRLADLDLSDCDEQQNCDSTKKNRRQVEIFDVSHHLKSPTSDCDSDFPKDKCISELEVSQFLGDSPAKIVCHRRHKKRLMIKQNVPNILVDVLSPQFKVNVKQIKNTSTENINFIKPDKEYETKSVKSTSKPRKKGRVVPSRYMQCAQNFRARTPVYKESKSSHNLTLTEANSGSGEEISSVISGNSNTNCNNQSTKTSSDEPTYSFTKLKVDDKVGDTDSKQTSTPNKDDLPLPYSDASTIIQDVSTYSDVPKHCCRRDIFKTIKNNNDASLPLDEAEQKAPLNQIDVDILYNNYIQTLYLDKMMQKAIQKREADAARQIHDFYNLTQSENETELDLHLKLRKINHNKLVIHFGELQRNAVSNVSNSLSDMKSKHHNLAKVLDTVPHQIATEGIFHPNDETYIDDLTNNFIETEQLLEKIDDVTESKMPSLSLYNSHLKRLVETISTEKGEIEQINELLAAIESLTIQQASLKFQHLEEEMESELLLDI